MKGYFLILTVVILSQNVMANPQWLKIVRNEVSEELFEETPLASLSLLRDKENKMVPVFNYEGKYTIQVSSYKSEIEAINHAEKIKQNDPRVFYQPIKIDSKIWYRVNVGNFTDLDLAKSEYGKFLEKNEEKKSFVTFLATDKDKQVILFKGPQPKEKRKVANVEDSTKEFLYTIQVGSFESQKEAESKSEKYKSASGDKTYVHTVSIKGKEWYRLYVGRFEDKEQTQEFIKTNKVLLGGAFIKKVHPKHLSAEVK